MSLSEIERNEEKLRQDKKEKKDSYADSATHNAALEAIRKMKEI